MSCPRRSFTGARASVLLSNGTEEIVAVAGGQASESPPVGD